MAISKTTDDLLKDFSTTIAVSLVAFGTLCLQAWLVSICAGLLIPGFSLTFWNWVLIVGTFRFVTAVNSSK
jgi:hypothetical protein